MTRSHDWCRTVNSTYRNSSAIGRANAVPRAVMNLLASGEIRPRTILDFGSGKDDDDAAALRAMGYDVTAHDTGRNYVSGIHDPDALDRQYDLVFASNVLNVQPTLEDLVLTVDEIAGAVAPGGALVANYYPTKDAKWPREVFAMLEERFAAVERVKGEKSRMWLCRGPLPRSRRCSCKAPVRRWR